MTTIEFLILLVSLFLGCISLIAIGYVRKKYADKYDAFFDFMNHRLDTLNSEYSQNYQELNEIAKTLISDKIVALDKILNSKGLTEKEVEVYKEQLEKYQKM